MRPLGRRPRLAMLPPDMARGRPWTKAEDRELRQAAKSNRNYGILTHETKRTDPRPFTAEKYRASLRCFAERWGRTYAAVRKRASRLEIRSYPTGDWIWK